MQEGHWFLENLALILGLAFIFATLMYGIKVWQTQSVDWREAIGAIAVFLIGVVIVGSQIGLL